jgi:hypothetical protein
VEVLWLEHNGTTANNDRTRTTSQKEMEQNKRLKLSLIQKLTHYGIVFFLLILVLLTVLSLVEIYLTKTYTGVRTADELINSSLPFLILAFIFTFIQYRRLNFKEYKISFTESQFQEAVKRTESQLGWRIEKNNKSVLVARRNWDWSGSWGELVTIIKKSDRVYINSICDPDNISSVVSFGWNKKNRKAFLLNLTDVIANKPVEVKIEKETNEWSIKRIAIRLVAYPFCIFLILFGSSAIIHPLTSKSIFVGLGAIAIASVYLYSDITLLCKRKGPKP